VIKPRLQRNRPERILTFILEFWPLYDCRWRFRINVVEEFKRAGFPTVSKVIDTYDLFGKHVHYRIELRHYLAINRYVATIYLSVERDEDSLKQRMEIFTDFPRDEKETYDAALVDALDVLQNGKSRNRRRRVDAIGLTPPPLGMVPTCQSCLRRRSAGRGPA
jgi:hypothetical protein